MVEIFGPESPDYKPGLVFFHPIFQNSVIN